MNKHIYLSIYLFTYLFSVCACAGVCICVCVCAVVGVCAYVSGLLYLECALNACECAHKCRGQRKDLGIISLQKTKVLHF